MAYFDDPNKLAQWQQELARLREKRELVATGKAPSAETPQAERASQAMSEPLQAGQELPQAEYEPLQAEHEPLKTVPESFTWTPGPEQASTADDGQREPITLEQLEIDAGMRPAGGVTAQSPQAVKQEAQLTQR